MILSDFGIKRPTTVTMIFLAITVLGLIAMMTLKMDLMPNVDIPIVVVMAEYRGVGPREIESMVTKTLESAVSQVPDIKNVYSISKEGHSIVIAEFEWGVGVDQAASDIRERVDMVKRYLPSDVSNPTIVKFDPSMIPVNIIGVSSRKRNLVDLREYAEDEVSDELARLDGVAIVQVNGGRKREIHVDLEKSRLEGLGITTDQIKGALASSNLNLPGGHLKPGQQNFIIRTTGEFASVAEIGQTVVGSRGGVPVFLRDVAKIRDSYADRDGEVLMNGEPAVVLIVQKQSSANTVQVSDRVIRRVAELQKNAPDDITINISMDTAEFIRGSIRSLRDEALVGGLLAVLVIILFLHSFSSTVIIALAIPFSIIATFILMQYNNMTLNIITLGGLALGVGRLVDDSIVVLENIYRHREQGKDPRAAALVGSSEVAMAVLAATITAIVVFLPIAYVKGMAGVMFKPMALTVAFALGSSYFISMMLVPLLTTKLMKVEHNRLEKNDWFHRALAGFEGWLKFLDGKYQQVLVWAITHKKTMTALVTVLALVSLSLLWPLKLVGGEFVPQSDEGEFTIQVKLPAGIGFKRTSQVMKQVDAIVRQEVPEARNVFTTMGEGEGMQAMMGGTGVNSGQMRVRLGPRNDRKRSVFDIADALRQRFATIPDATATIITGDNNSGGSIGGSIMSGGNAGALEVEIQGYDLMMADSLAEQIKTIMNSIPGAKDARKTLQPGFPELQVMIDREKAGGFGLSTYQVAGSIETMFKGNTVTRFRDQRLGKEYDVVVRLTAEDRLDRAALANISFPSPIGQPVSLSNIAKIGLMQGPVDIARKNQQRQVNVSCDIKGRPLSEVSRDLTQKLAGLNIPPGFNIVVGGAAKDMQDSMKDLMLAALLAMLLVYMVLAAQFESLLDPFVVLFSVPLGIIGVVWGLFFFGMNLSVIAFIGIIMMIGIVVSNAILLVDYSNQLKRQGMELYQAVVLAGRTRLRPILMTSLTTMLGMVPMALGMGESGETIAPLAVAVIFGLSASMLLTLVFVPSLYVIFEERLRK